MQLVQTLCPAVPANVPARHDAHGPPTGPAAPASQTHAAPSPLDAEEEDSGGHVWHTSESAPSTAENFPGLQLVHSLAPAAAWNVPALQLAHALAPAAA